MKLLLVLPFLAAAAAARSTKNNASPVLVELYYESYCPDCRQYIQGELQRTWQKLGKTGLMDVRLYPFGNAEESEGKKEGRWKYQCQHGPKECVGNLLEACIIEGKRRVFSDYLPVIRCVEKGLDIKADPMAVAKRCVEKDKSLSWPSISNCASGPSGNSLMHEYALRTASLRPAHEYVPWVTIDGEHEASAEEDGGLLAAVCRAYKGRRPKECQGEEEDEWEELEISISVV